jgi:hypothetical protein
MDMRLGTWNICTRTYRKLSLRIVAEEVSKHKLDLVGYRRSDGIEMAPIQQANIHFFYGNGNDSHELGAGFFSYIRETYQQLRGD